MGRGGHRAIETPNMQAGVPHLNDMMGDIGLI